MRIEIASRSNPRVKELLDRKADLIFFEGDKLVRDVLSRDLIVSKLLMSAEMERSLPPIAATVVERWVVSRPVLDKLTDLKTSPAMIAVLEMPAWEIDFKRHKVVFGFDTIQDPGNLGTVFRCASAFGISALAMAGACVRVSNPKVVRTAQTALLDTPFQAFPSLDALISSAEAQGAHIYATGSHATGRLLAVEDMRLPCLVLFGNEGQGLEPGLLKRFPLIRLDQKDRIDSLNVAVSACILMHEVKRIHGL